MWELRILGWEMLIFNHLLFGLLCLFMVMAQIWKNWPREDRKKKAREGVEILLCWEAFYFISACFALKSFLYLLTFHYSALSAFTEEYTRFNGVPWFFPLKYLWVFSSFFHAHLLLHQGRDLGGDSWEEAVQEMCVCDRGLLPAPGAERKSSPPRSLPASTRSERKAVRNGTFWEVDFDYVISLPMSAPHPDPSTRHESPGVK